MKVLFLDHDGVICLSTEWGGRFDRDREGLDSVFDDFNLKAIEVLNEVIEATDCEIVISSDWRHHATLEQMQELYKIRGIKKSPIDFTGVVKYSSALSLEKDRSIEIREWLNAHPEVTSWVAVDDMDLGATYGPVSKNYIGGLTNFVRTPHSRFGIRQEGKKEAIIEILNKI